MASTNEKEAAEPQTARRIIKPSAIPIYGFSVEGKQ
jgi:hypothetical protein